MTSTDNASVGATANAPTPSTSEVRAAYAVAMFSCSTAEERRWHDNLHALYEEAFDRWMAARAAEKWDEGFDAGERDVLEHNTFDEPCISNPYRRTDA